MALRMPVAAPRKSPTSQSSGGNTGGQVWIQETQSVVKFPIMPPSEPAVIPTIKPSKIKERQISHRLEPIARRSAISSDRF